MNWIKADQITGKIAGPVLPMIALIMNFGFISLEIAAISIMIILFLAWVVSNQANRALKQRILELEQQHNLVSQKEN
jgi:hypothetical protein